MENQDPPAPAGIDITRPSVARMYDYSLGGKTNYKVDRDALDQVLAVAPQIKQLALANRGFMRRAVRHMARQGIKQFIDIGSGLPTNGNTHEVAQQMTPEARVVYVDNDPVVLVYGDALLAKDKNTTVISGDMRRPDEVLGHPETTRLIDFNEPVGLLMIAMAHFLRDDEYPAIIQRLYETVPAGSHLAITHATADGCPDDLIAKMQGIYANTSAPLIFRTRAEIEKIFGGFGLTEPGVVNVGGWYPDPADPLPKVTVDWLSGGVGHKSA